MISIATNNHIPTTTTSTSTTSFLIETIKARDDRLMQRTRDEYDTTVFKLSRPEETKCIRINKSTVLLYGGQNVFFKVIYVVVMMMMIVMMMMMVVVVMIMVLMIMIVVVMIMLLMIMVMMMMAVIMMMNIMILIITL
jgi:hypothetical protein